MVSRQNVEGLKLALDELAADGLLVSVVEGGGSTEVDGIPGEALALEVVGQDRTGIVSQISQALAELGVNVEELITECSSAPMSGERLFEATAVIMIPEGVTEQDVQAGIEAIAQDLAVTISDLDD